MGKFCKNCAAYIDDTTQFCPDCGREVDQYIVKYCPNCGEKLLTGENFCKSCGVRIKEPNEPIKESFLEKYKVPIIIVVVIAVVAVIALGAVFTLEPGTISPQEIHVDSISVNIPEDYIHDQDLDVNETEGGIKTVSQFWENGDEYIQIDVVYSTNSDMDANQLASDIGGDNVTMLGYNGYFNELSDSYSFSFVKHNKIITLYTNNMEVFNQIEVLS